MKITFTSTEIIYWLEALNNHFSTDSPEAIQQYNMIVKKLKNAEIRSQASRGKIRAIRDSQRKKQQIHDDQIRKEVLEAYCSSRRMS